MVYTRTRFASRTPLELRPMNVAYDVYGYASASVLFELGKTKVFCAVTLQAGVPYFLKGKKVGWLTAEYAMLPSSTTTRLQRDSSTVSKNGRSVEISRLIGRSLRTVVDLTKLGEYTIIIDCDVLQADGGTRTACITGACLALYRAVAYWQRQGIIKESIFKEPIAAVSVGITNGQPLLDMDFAEDSSIDADFNFVFTRNGALIEVQGTAEKNPVARADFVKIQEIAYNGVQPMFDLYEQALSDNTQKSCSSSYLNKAL